MSLTGRKESKIMDDQEFAYLKKKIRQYTRMDLDGYKSQQVRRRLEGYIRRFSGSVQEYAARLEKDTSLCHQLVDYLAINVSEFFRDSHYFTYLKADVLPELRKAKARLNIWSAACSCGQEPYTLAMILEEMGNTAYRILATDIDLSALESARKGGPYTEQDVRNIDSHLRKKYLVYRDGAYWVHESLRRHITFKVHNVQSDPFERGFDLILCRNAIIYFSDVVRDKIYRDFHSSLNSSGVLFIGGSEAILHPDKMGFKTLRSPFYIKTDHRVPVPAMDVAERKA